MPSPTLSRVSTPQPATVAAGAGISIRSDSLRSTEAEPCSRDRVRDVTALVILATCIFVLLALFTFDAADPPHAGIFPRNARVHNACGFWGSTIAGLLYECFGAAAWLVVFFIIVLDGSLLLRAKLFDLPLRTAGAIAATVGSSALLSMLLPDWIARPLWGPGGYLGATAQVVAEIHFAHTGATIIFGTLLCAGLFVAIDSVLMWFLLRVIAPATMAIICLPQRVLRLWCQKQQKAVPMSNAFNEFHAVDRENSSQNLSEPRVRVRRRENKPVVENVSPIPVLKIEKPVVIEDSGLSGVVPVHSRKSRKMVGGPLETPLEISPNYQLPSLELLLPTDRLTLDAQEQEVREKARMLEKTFADFGFKVRVVEIETGPVISQYEIELEAGLRLSKISTLADDLAVALRVPSVRIVTPIPGKNTIGIEVPNNDRQMVRLREVIEETQAKSRTMKIPVYLGKDVAGSPMVVDLASLPHLLIAGRTGTGKSVCLNSIIVSILMSRRPDEVRMLMIDPKMVELTPYKTLPHLMHPVVTDMKKAEAILAWAVLKMEERYMLLANVGVRHISQYNQLGRDEIINRLKPQTDDEAAEIPSSLPFIVVIADEIADMMMTAGKEIEQHIIRLAQKSRAVGIHLVLATQKPTVDVITGLIKSNLPARIAFQVASRTDSRVVLDECGADRLLGNGDMLYLSPGTSTIMRGQGTFVSDDEIERVMGAVGTTEPQYAQELVNLQPAHSGDTQHAGDGSKQRDELYEAAIEVVIREGRGSVSLLQRALGVGYGRAARLIDFMAEDGIVGVYAGSQAREVLLTFEQWALRSGSPIPAADPQPRRLKIQPHAETTLRKSVPAIEEIVDNQSDAEDDEANDSFIVDAKDVDDESLSEASDDDNSSPSATASGHSSRSAW